MPKPIERRALFHRLILSAGAVTERARAHLLAHNLFQIFCIPNSWKEQEAEHLRQVYDAIARGLEILKAPLPDTFVGRKSQDPFPKEKEE